MRPTEDPKNRVGYVRGGRPTIGLLITRLTEPFQESVWRGVADGAAAADANLVCFTGMPLHSPYGGEEVCNAVYGLAGPQNLDGMIFSPGSLGTFITPAERAAIHEQYEPLPLVAIGLPVPGHPCVLVDNVPGLRWLIRHLIQAHGRRRLAFIQGPVGHEEADVRFQVYRDVLAENGIAFDAGLVIPGDFSCGSGREGIAALLARGAEFDAVVAVNDHTAIGAVTALEDRGIDVPGRVAVIGFDGLEYGRYLDISLTTVQQPAYELGRRAVELLLLRLRGREVPEQVTLAAEPVIGQSCGCLIAPKERTAGAAGGDRPIAPVAREIAAAAMRIAGTSAAALGAGKTIPAERIELFVNTLLAEAAGREENVFLPALLAALRQGHREGLDFQIWLDILPELRRRILAAVAPAAKDKADELLFSAAMLVGRAAPGPKVNRWVQLVEQIWELGSLAEQISAAVTLEQMAVILSGSLPMVGIEHCYLSMYHDPRDPIAQSCLVMARDENGISTLRDGKRLFPTRRLIPDEFYPAGRHSLLVGPLYYADLNLGFIVLDLKEEIAVIYESIIKQISGTLRSITLLDERRRAEEALARRTEELARSNLELQQFAYTASHDLQEPLRMVTSFLQLLSERYKERLDPDADDFIAFAVDGAARMQQLIQALLSYSRVGTRGKPFAPADGGQVLQSALNNLKMALEETGAIVTHDPLPVFTADETQMIQLFQNLIGNAVKFHRGETPHVHVAAARQGDEWLFAVSDNGIGIVPEHTERIFQVFQRLHTRGEYPGTGIGLAVCQKIIKRHGGRIWVESEPGKGSTFYFTIPDRAENSPEAAGARDKGTVD